MKNSESIVKGPAQYLSWALSILKEFYIVIDVDDSESTESETERYKEYYKRSKERVV